MNKESEACLFKTAGVSAIQQCENFPFSDYREFVRAVAEGDASIGIEYGPARQAICITKGKGADYLVAGISWLPLLLAGASVVVAVMWWHWAFLLGVPAALVGTIIASPYNPLRRIFHWVAFMAVFYILYSHKPTHPLDWTALCYAISFGAVAFINFCAWRWAHQAAMESEAVAALLFVKGYMHIRDSSGNSHSSPAYREGWHRRAGMRTER